MNARKRTASVLAALVSAPLVCALALPTDAIADEDSKRSKQEVDTEFIFGFTEGADVGELGEKEIEHQTIAGLSKRTGSYTAIIDDLRYEHAPFENFRFEIGGLLDYHSIAGVPGLDDRQQFAFDGVVMQMRYRLLDREHAPFAFTVRVEPHWSRADETSGEGVENFGGDIAVALDRELSSTSSSESRGHGSPGSGRTNPFWESFARRRYNCNQESLSEPKLARAGIVRWRGLVRRADHVRALL